MTLEAAPVRESYVLDPPSGRHDAIRYGTALIAVAAGFIGLVILLGSSRPIDHASEASEAVLVELPPADTAGRSGYEADDDRSQEASAASAHQERPQAESPLQADEPAKPKVTPPTLSPPPPVRDPTAVIEREMKTRPNPQPAAAPRQVAREALSPSGSIKNAEADTNHAGEDVPHASRRVFSIWQKAMIDRLERARRSISNGFQGGGTAKVAFSINRNGRLAAVRVLRSSGSTSLDQAALELVRRAAPFPKPPAGTPEISLSFVVPVHFRSRR